MENVFCECHLLPIMILPFFLISLAECLSEWAMEKRWRRKSLEFLSNEDIVLLNEYLNAHYPEFTIGELIKNSYKKDKDLKTFQKEKWKKICNKLLFWKKKDS